METNKTIITQFYKNVVGGRDSSLIDTYVHPNYIQHSPNAKDGREGLFAMVEFLRTLPEPEVIASPIKHIISQGDFAVVHLELEFMGKHLRVIELFRIAGGMLAEHWDVTEEQNGNREPVINIAKKVSGERNAYLRKWYDKQHAIIHHLVEENDHIAIHAETEWDGRKLALFGIYHFMGNEILERWTVKQIVPDVMLHQNGMF